MVYPTLNKNDKHDDRFNENDKSDETFYWYTLYLKLILKHQKLFLKDKEVVFQSDIDPYDSVNREITKNFNNKEIFCHLIADSIYCINEVLEISNAYGRSYMLNNSIIGAFYEKMLFWFIWYIALNDAKLITSSGNYKNDASIKKSITKISNAQSEFVKEFKAADVKENKNDNDKKSFDLRFFDQMRETLQRNLNSWMDHDALESQSIVYHAEMAIKRYYAAYETHIGGKEYRYFIDKMYFLNDDFNDKFSHFFAAYERFSLNNKGIGDKLDKIKNFNKISKLYQYKYFTKTQLSE